jgi:aminopeptidase N
MRLGVFKYIIIANANNNKIVKGLKHQMTYLKSAFKLGILVATLSMIAACSVKPLSPNVAKSGSDYTTTDKQTDVLHYDLALEIFPKKQLIAGSNDIQFKMLSDASQVVFKLDDRFSVPEITINQINAEFVRKDGEIAIIKPGGFTNGNIYTIRVVYSGSPHVAKNAPWDGGIMWSKTDSGEDWIATAIQGYGCDVWWPCKDHFLDKPSSVDLRITVPKGLVAVMNGRLQSVEKNESTSTYHWRNHSAITDYNIALNIGPYINIAHEFKSVTGEMIPLEFWSLKSNKEKAKKLLYDDILPQMKYLESVLGAFPWQQDKIGFVETPHLGMEHQTVNGYGNGYKQGIHGFDWLLHHELVHEWFGNLITHKTGNDAWIHESFAMYMQPAYAKHLMGEAYYQHFMYEELLNINSCKPVLQEEPMGFHEAAHGDTYFKGAWVLHTLRWLIGDEAFWQVMQQFLYGDQLGQKRFESQYRSTQDFLNTLKSVTGDDYQWLIDGYLRQAKIPKIITTRTSTTMSFEWSIASDFPMPIPVEVNGEMIILNLLTGKAEIPVDSSAHVLIDPNMNVLRELPVTYSCEQSKLQKSRF